MAKRAQRLEPHLACLLLVMSLLPFTAHAHVGIGQTAGFMRGFEHPLGGLDHVIAMVTVGLWAAQRADRALWVIPASFVTVMVASAWLGAMHVAIPFIEPGIALSVLVLGILVAASVRLPVLASSLIVGLFAVFHGYAHGAEIPANASGVAYGAGFASATALLHGLGIGFALLARRFAESDLLRLSGVAAAAYGIYLSTAL